MGIRDYIKKAIDNEEKEEEKILGDDSGSEENKEIGESTEDNADGSGDYFPPEEGDKSEPRTPKKGSEPAERKAEDTESVKTPEQKDLFRGTGSAEKTARSPKKTLPDNGKGSVEEEIFDLQGVKGKIKFGDKVVTLEELRNGVMFQDDYTRKRQYYKPIEDLVDRLRSNPAELVKYATENGLSKEELLKALGAELPSEKKPPEEEKVPEFETEIEKKMYFENRALKKSIEDLKGMIESKIVPGIEKSERMSRTFSEANEIRRFNDGFEAFSPAYNVPNNARFMVKLLLDKGQALYGKDYTIEAAMIDYTKGQRVNAEFNMDKWIEEHPEKVQELRDKWLNESEKQKSDIRRKTITPDSVGGTSKPLDKGEKREFKSPREAAEAYKRERGFTDS